MKKYIIVISLIFISFLFSPSDIYSACNPPECGAKDSQGKPLTCTSPDHCNAKCCVAPEPPDLPVSTPRPDGSGGASDGNEVTCTSVGPTGIPDVPSGAATYDVYAYGVANASSVVFPTWSVVASDITWYQGVDLGDGTWRATINFSNHPYLGYYGVHVYLNENILCGIADFIRPNHAPAGDFMAASCSNFLAGHVTQIVIQHL